MSKKKKITKKTVAEKIASKGTGKLVVFPLGYFRR